jgi:NAD(P)-dependent dehydrogenase (short-subunit alcohol dehydrogenase family)
MTNVLITGANRGIGLALAARFAARPDTRVFATARRVAAATDLAALRDAHPNVEILEADVSRAASVRALAEAVQSRDVFLDVLLNNAGAANWKPLGEIEEDEIAEILRVNAIGPVLVTQALLGRIRDGAKIINVTSVLGSIERASGGSGVAYPMSKAALNMFSKLLALDVRERGIAVLALHPGWVRTRMGGDEATLTVDQSADGIMRVIDALDLAKSGIYLAYDGSALPW